MIRRPLAFDNETLLITDEDKCPPIVCVAWAERLAGNVYGSLFKHDGEMLDPHCFLDPRDQIASWLEDDSLVLCNVNIAYDMAGYLRQWPELTPLIFEAYERDRVCSVDVSTKLVDNAEGIMHRHPVTAIGNNGKPTCYSAAALAKRFLARDLDKATWRLGYDKLMHVPLAEWPAGARQYAIDDAVAALEIYEALQLGYPELLADQFRQARHAFWTYLVGAHGVVTDPVRVRHLEQKLLADKEATIKRLSEAGLIRVGGTRKAPKWVKDTKAAKALMIHARGGFDKCEKTEGGDVSLGKEACEAARLLNGCELLWDYHLLATYDKRLGTEIKALKLGCVRVRYDSFKENGRTGTSEPANVQNLPRAGGERECYVPREGFLFADADYDMLELRTWAQACLELLGESTLADDLNGGVDVHLSMAGEIFDGGGHSYDEMKGRKKEARVKEARQTAKPVNFMLPGGGGAERLVAAAKKDYGIIFPRDEEKDWTYTKVDNEWVKNYRVPGIHFARELIKAWKRKRPEAQPYLDHMSEAVEEAHGKATFKAWFVDRYHGGLGYCDLANYTFSCLANDAAKDAGWRVTRCCYDWTQGDVLYGSRVALFLHDQIITEVPIPVAHECAVSLGKHMIAEASRWLPDVPPTTTPCLATCLSKMAEAYYTCDMKPGCTHEHCKLVPWSLEGEVAKVLAEGLRHVMMLWEKTKKEAA